VVAGRLAATPQRTMEIMSSLERNLNDMREYYESGKTKQASWRESQLKGLRLFLMEKQEHIMNALMQDLGKHQLEAFRDEVSLIFLLLLYCYDMKSIVMYVGDI